MRTIWKYQLGTFQRQTVDMPSGAEVIRVGTQFGMPCIWALVDPHAGMTSRTFAILPTGAHFHEAETRYLGTFETYDGAGIWHIVESR